MKTNVVMVRQLEGFEIHQRTKDGYFNANVLLNAWNKKTGANKEIKDFMRNQSTQEFIEEIAFQENLHGEKSPYVTSRARADRGGGTWMHPLLFIDFAMWLNPRFKYHVLKFVYDNLIQFRNDSGDGYIKMCEAIYSRFNNSQRSFQEFIKGFAAGIKQACGVKDWEHATEAQLAKRQRIHDVAFMLCELVPLSELLPTVLRKIQ